MIFIGELQQGAIGADGDDPQGDRLAASSQSSVGGVLQPAAAGAFFLIYLDNSTDHRTTSLR